MKGSSVLLAEEEVRQDRGFIWKHIGKLAWPCAVEQLFSSLISAISMMLVTSIGTEAVNAVSVTNQPMYIPFVVFRAFNVGGTALVARFLGMRDEENAKRACAQSLLLTFAMGLLAAIGLYFGAGAIIRFIGATDDYYYLAMRYMNYVSVSIIFQSISIVAACMLRGAGRTSLSMYFNVLASIVNVVVGYILISVVGMGIDGAGIAFLVAQFSGAAFALYLLLCREELPIHIRLKDLFKIDRSIIRRIAHVGLGAALEQMALRVGLMTFTMLIVGLGTAEYAAHNIAGTMYNYVIAFGQAIGMALTSLVGQNLGADRADLAERYIKEALYIALICAGVLMAILLLLPYQIASLFTDDPEVAKNVVLCLRLLALVTPAQIIQMSICGGLRGGGDTRWPMVSTMAGVLGMRMAMGYLFIHLFDWGLAGAWLACILDQNMRAGVIYLRMRSGKWKRQKV